MGQASGEMTRAGNKSHRDEALWQLYQLNAKTVADDRSKQRNVTRALAVIVVTLLVLGGLMIWAAWL